MGTTLTSIHIYGAPVPSDCDFSFCSYSENWHTCTSDFPAGQEEQAVSAAKLMSKKTSAPVLCFHIFDSEMIWLCVFRGGKMAARYSDDNTIANKKIFDIPALVGYGEGYKKRLSSLLDCSDTERKVALLEEYFGVCLLYDSELANTPEQLRRTRGDALYREYMEEEKQLSGKKAPMELKCIAEYPGKIFFNDFGDFDNFNKYKKHYFLYGFTEATDDLTPVHFTGTSLEPCDRETFEKDRIIRNTGDSRFVIEYRPVPKVTFSDDAPAEYRGKTMKLPVGVYPWRFLPSGELLLLGKSKIYVVDHALTVVAKFSCKGEVADIVDNCILTATGASFYGYCYEPKAKVYIYEIVKK